MITFDCPSCLRQCEAASGLAGASTVCTKCGALVRVPGVSQAHRTDPFRSAHWFVYTFRYPIAAAAALLVLFIVVLFCGGLLASDIARHHY